MLKSKLMTRPNIDKLKRLLAETEDYDDKGRSTYHKLAAYIREAGPALLKYVEELETNKAKLQDELTQKYERAVYWTSDIVIPSIVHSRDCTIQKSPDRSGPCSCGAFAKMTADKLPSYGEMKERLAELKKKVEDLRALLLLTRAKI
jgi:hypothetical protein